MTNSAKYSDQYADKSNNSPAIIQLQDYVAEVDNNSNEYSGETYSDMDKSLQIALTKLSDENQCRPEQGIQRIRVIGITKDKTQALFSRTCGGEAGLVQNFIINKNNNWIVVSPVTNSSSNGTAKGSIDNPNFSPLLDLPNCELVNKYSIQKSIAPVCFNRLDGRSDLYAGDTRNYSYTIR